MRTFRHKPSSALPAGMVVTGIAGIHRLPGQDGRCVGLNRVSASGEVKG